MSTLKHKVGTIIISLDHFWDDVIKGGSTFSWLLLWVDLDICKGKLCVERRCEGKVALKAFWCFILCTSPGIPTIVVVLIVIVTQITLVILIIITITIICIVFVIFFVLISFIPFIIMIIIITSIIPYFFNIVQNLTFFLASTWKNQAIPTALIGDSDKVRIMMIMVIMISFIVITSMMSVMKMRMTMMTMMRATTGAFI